METFASNLRKRAEQLGLSHAEVARRSGLSERRFGHYVSGRNEPDLATMVRIASVLETTPNVLLGAEAAPLSDILRDRINAAISAMTPADKEIVAACAEAILKLRG